jgi:hypothetical protein
MIRVVLGLVGVAGFGVLYVQGKLARTEVEKLRAEVALARIEGALTKPSLVRQA